MPKGNETTTKFKVDIRELKAGMQEAQRQIKLANAQFKAAASGMDDWSKSSDGLSKKIESLKSVLDGENKKLESLKKQLALTEKEYGSNSKAADDLRIAIANQEATVNNTKRSIKNYEQQLADLDSENKDVDKSSKQATKGIKDIDKAADDARLNVGKLADSFAGALKKGLLSIGAAVAGATTAFLASAEATREYREDMNKLQTAFQTAGFSADTAKDTYREFYKVLGEEDRSVEAVNHLAQLTDSEEELAKWTDICAGVTATFGDSLPIEGLTEAANETAKVGQVTGPLADALNWAGISEDEFNEKLAACATEQERATLITETLNSTYADAAEKYKEMNKDVMASRDAQAALNDKMAEIGEKAEPIMTSLKQGFADILDAALKLVEDVDFDAIAGSIEDGFQYFIDEVIPKIIDGFNWILDNKDYIIAGIAGIAASFAAMKVVGIIQGIVAAMKAWLVATEGMTVAQRLLNLVMKANPIGIIISLIAGLVTAFVILWNKSEKFREFWINLWENIKAKAGEVIDAVAEFFSGLWDGIKEVWSVVAGWFGDIWDSIKDGASTLVESVKDFFEDAWNNIKSIWSAVTGFFKNIWDKVTSGAKEITTKVGDFFKNAWNGIKNIWNAVTGFFANIWSGIKNTFSTVSSWFTDIFSKAWNGIKNAFSKMTGFFSDIWTNIKNTFSKVGEVVGNAITNTVKKAVNGVLSTAIKIINGFISAINAAIGVINAIPGVKISKLDKLEVPQLYEGAVVKKGKQYLLEGRGDEAVVPLHNNKKWVSKTAKDLKSSLQNEGVIGTAKNPSNPVTNNYNFVQNNTSPKALSRLEIYRQTKNQLAFAKGV